jgi:hypothetical protein
MHGEGLVVNSEDDHFSFFDFAAYFLHGCRGRCDLAVL